jgi:hypothetical protein
MCNLLAHEDACPDTLSQGADVKAPGVPFRAFSGRCSTPATVFRGDAIYATGTWAQSLKSETKSEKLKSMMAIMQIPILEFD